MNNSGKSTELDKQSVSQVVFRKAKETTEESSPDSVKFAKKTEVSVSEEPKDLSPLSFAETYNKPFLSKILNIENNYHQLDRETKARMKAVEDYFLKEVKRHKYDDSEFAYREWWYKMLDITGTEEPEPMPIKVARVAEFLKYLERVKNYESAK